ncbi:MAG: response regulator, partial [Desulfarculaceae bacterium]
EKAILVVDDEKSIRDVISEAFEEAGYKVLSAGSAEAALEMLAGKNISVMFLDLRLPGMSGVELGRRIKKENPIACLFAITGYVSLFDLADCREAGFEDYFVKPVRLATLLKAAEQAFDKLERWRRQ